MPLQPKISHSSSNNNNNSKIAIGTGASKSTMKTSATARKTTTRTQAPLPTLSAGGAKPVLKPALKPSTRPRAPAVRRPVVPAAKRRVTTTTNTTPRRRFQPPPPPPMYWICYDFTVKLVRGLFLGVFVGLILTVVLPWVLDSGFWVYDAVTEADLSSLKMPDFSNYSLPSWSFNETSKLLWRVDQKSQQHSNLRSSSQTIAPTRDPKVVADESLLITFPLYNRTIAVVHAGHTGGRPIMELCPQVSCKARFAANPVLAQTCIQKSPTNATISPLAQQAKHYFHLGDIHHEELKQVTSFLFTLRNPVERMLAIFVDSHPLACTDKVETSRVERKPWGCQTKPYWNMPDTSQYTFYTRCFPERQPERFAQYTLSPWPNTTALFKFAETQDQQIHDCRWLAREMALGRQGQISLAPHAYHNYEFYMEKALYGTAQEVLAIRMEQEQEDLLTLHKLLGGDPMATLPQVVEPVTPSVTPEAYQKLCCVLYKEIGVYSTLLKRAINLPEYKKDETMDDLRQKCGVPSNSESSWTTWRSDCQNQLEMDEFVLTPNKN